MVSIKNLARFAPLVLSLSLTACGASPTPAPVSPQPEKHEEASNQIITNKVEGTAGELMAKGERALVDQKWQDAVDAFSAVIAAEPNGKHVPLAMYDLGFAYESLSQHDKARATYHDFTAKFPSDSHARAALQREANLDAYLEDWKSLGEVGGVILARSDLEDLDRMTGLGARGLSKIEAGDDTGASKDVQDGLDIVDANHYGALGRLPVAAAQLRFALAEIRRARSEKILLQPVTPDFVIKLETRCAGLLDAQAAYADAIRSIDPHWAAMSGFRVGEMYRTLHREIMSIPPTELAKTSSDKELFYAIMHVRYRALIEKGLEMMNRTLALAEKTQDATVWVKRATEAKTEMENAIVEEKAQLAKLPYTEADVQKALDIMKEKALKKQAEMEKKQAEAEKRANAGKK